MNPAAGGIVYFTEATKKACFLKELRENKQPFIPKLLLPVFTPIPPKGGLYPALK
jgi:hypothetical protein